jgi:uncharacterized protein YjbJ (UPF0337 family)
MDKRHGHEVHRGNAETSAWEGIEKIWGEFKARAQDRWDRLTEQEFDEIAGSYDRLIGKLQEKYELTREQAVDELKDFLNTFQPGA